MPVASANIIDYWFKEALQSAPTNVRIYQSDCQRHSSICLWEIETDTHKSRSDVDNICNDILALEKNNTIHKILDLPSGTRKINAPILRAIEMANLATKVL